MIIIAQNKITRKKITVVSIFLQIACMRTMFIVKIQNLQNNVNTPKEAGDRTDLLELRKLINTIGIRDKLVLWKNVIIAPLFIGRANKQNSSR